MRHGGLHVAKKKKTKRKSDSTAAAVHATPVHFGREHHLIGGTWRPIVVGALPETIPVLGPNFVISLQLRIHAMTGGSGNILHLSSTGKGCCGYGDRVVKLSLHSGTSVPKIIVGSPGGGNNGNQDICAGSHPGALALSVASVEARAETPCRQ
jgi:hypothetical protein